MQSKRFKSQITNSYGGLKGLQNTKFCTALLILVMFAAIFSLSPAFSLLINSVIIGCTGRIATEKASIIYKSEIRGVHIADSIFAFPHDWNVIAETLAGYKINFVTVLLMGLPTGSRPDAEWRACIQAFHSRGIEVHISYHVIGEMAVKEEYKCETSTGTKVDWNCPTKQAFRQDVKTFVERIASTYDIDGIMFDYARYPGDNMCYCSECKQAFEAWLGEGAITDWTPFYANGTRYKKFMEWRTIPVTNIVRDAREWMLAINPNLKFSLAQWTLFGYSPNYSPTYWRYWNGQDAAYWVAMDYLDMTQPMMYTGVTTGEPHSIETYILANRKYVTGEIEGKIPLVAFITTGVTKPLDPLAFKAVVDKVREIGADGWIIWRYGGPGVNDGGYHIDIRPYLDLLTLPDVFSLSNIQVSVSGSDADITWSTDLPATSRVEYSTSPLFNATKKLDVATSYNYWDVDHIQGQIVEDLANVTSHDVKLTGLSAGVTYYLRVQSQDEHGTATSETFTLNLST